MIDGATIVIGLLLAALYATSLKKETPLTFQEKVEMAGVWSEIEFSNEAVPLGVRSFQIATYDRGQLQPPPLFLNGLYSEFRARALRREGHVVLPVDLYKEIPDDFTAKPPIENVLDNLELSRWVE
jgi:hypothetical protein